MSLLPGRGRDPDSYRKIGLYTAIPIMMVVGPVAGYMGGRWLEGRLGGEPWISFFGMILGLVASVRQVILVIQRGTEEMQRGKSSKKPRGGPREPEA